MSPRPRRAPHRNCARCGTPLGRRWTEYNLCKPCITEGQQAAADRTTERRKRLA